MSSGNKKDQLRQAAIRVLSEKGLERTKVSDVVREAGVAQGTFYLYYDSKNALIPDIAETMLLHMLGDMKTAIPAETPFLEQLEAIIRITFSTTFLYRDVLGLCYSGMATTGFFQEWERIYTPYYDWLEERICRAMEKGEIRGDMSVEMIAKILVEMMEGIAEQAYLFEAVEGEALAYQEALLQFASSALRLGQPA